MRAIGKSAIVIGVIVVIVVIATLAMVEVPCGYGGHRFGSLCETPMNPLGM